MGSETALNDTEDLITTSEAGDTLMQDVIDKINNQTGDTDSLRMKRSAPVVWECSQFSDEVSAWQSQAANLADMDKEARAAWLAKGVEIKTAVVMECPTNIKEKLRARKKELKEKKKAVKKLAEDEKEIKKALIAAIA